jgi:alcohol dehydrogenase (cytochrome c)
MYSSLLTTAGGLLFAGDLKGNALAYDAATGSGFRGGPVTYIAGGHHTFCSRVDLVDLD